MLAIVVLSCFSRIKNKNTLAFYTVNKLNRYGKIHQGNVLLSPQSLKKQLPLYPK